MPTLTLELIAANPWNAVDCDLAPHANGEFLEVALDAVNYCVTSQHALFRAARDGRYVPSWWRTDEVCPDAHEEAEAYWLRALGRYEMIDEKLQMLESANDAEGLRAIVAKVMSAWIRSLKNVGMFVKYKALRWDG